MDQDTTSPRKSGINAFPQTRWTLIIQAASSNEATACQALEEICQHYWYPIYSFLRRSGQTVPDAEDLTQGFFAELLSGEMLKSVSSDKGRLRTFLLGSLKRFLAREYRHASAAKRGGKADVISLDQEEAEARYLKEFTTEASPDLLYDRAWALDITARARETLESNYAKRGKQELFGELNVFLNWDEGNTPYQDAAARLGISDTHFRTSVYRMRKEYRDLLEQEITATVQTLEQAREELQHLVDILGAP